MSASAAPVVVHVISSPFYGGPERQIVGMPRALAPAYRTIVAAFPTGGKSRAVPAAAAEAGLDTVTLAHDNPHAGRMIRELAGILRTERASLLGTHHYKADVIGRAAAWTTGIPCNSVSHGWTTESGKVRLIAFAGMTAATIANILRRRVHDDFDERPRLVPRAAFVLLASMFFLRPGCTIATVRTRSRCCRSCGTAVCGSAAAQRYSPLRSSSVSDSAEHTRGVRPCSGAAAPPPPLFR
jgi:hypothetical protein